MMSLDERLDKAEEMIQKSSFRENKGLGNEVGYYIFDYPAEKELYISCLLYTSDAADEEDSGDIGCRRITKKKKKRNKRGR